MAIGCARPGPGRLRANPARPRNSLHQNTHFVDWAETKQAHFHMVKRKNDNLRNKTKGKKLSV